MRRYFYVIMLLVTFIIVYTIINTEEILPRTNKYMPNNLENVSDFEDTYSKIEAMPIPEAVKYLKNEYLKVKRFIPQFPFLPKYRLFTTKGKCSSIGERNCIEFLETLFSGHKFEKVRPKWLRNPKTNYPLELDGYNEDLKIGIEYNGIQHYVWPNFCHKTEALFLEQRYRDKVKIEICKRKNICLIIIPYTVPREKIPLAIYSKLIDGALY